MNVEPLHGSLQTKLHSMDVWRVNTYVEEQ